MAGRAGYDGNSSFSDEENVISDRIGNLKMKKVQNFSKKFCTFIFCAYICNPK